MSRHCGHGRPSTLSAKGRSCTQPKIAQILDLTGRSSGGCRFKQRLDATRAEAIPRGVFGVPTVDAGSRLYFGSDRLGLLNRHISRGKIALA